MFDYSRKPVKWQVGNFSKLYRYGYNIYVATRCKDTKKNKTIQQANMNFWLRRISSPSPAYKRIHLPHIKEERSSIPRELFFSLQPLFIIHHAQAVYHHPSYSTRLSRISLPSPLETRRGGAGGAGAFPARLPFAC